MKATSSKVLLALPTVLLVAATLAVGCTPPPPASSPPVDGNYAPTISSFRTATVPGTSPALVTLAWNVSDRNGEDVTCDIDLDSDGSAEITITACQGKGSRNVTLAAVDGVSTTHKVTLSATDGLVVNGVLRSVTKKLDITIAPGPSEPFDITLIGVDSLDAAVAAEFSAAAAKWEQVITTGLPDIDGSTLGCTPEEGRPIPASIDDLAIYTEVVPIDGVGGTLGSAGPTCMVRATELGVIGIMQFDEADVASMLSNGTLRSVILHEMGHVLGIGTLWDTSFASGARHLLSGAGSADPRFLGTAAGSEWGLLGGTSTVPVENTGGPGTADSHWRETIFTTELMTGWMNSGAQMSAMTIASLADLGYHVDMSQAEPFQLNPGAGAVARWSNLLQPSLTMLRPPIQVG